MAESVSTKMEGKQAAYKGKKLRVAIIGCGGIAQTHLNTYKEIPEVEIVAGVDIVPERLDVMHEKWGVPREALFLDWKEMLKVVKPDAVDVCTPNGVHCAPVVDACNAGCHAIVEKRVPKPLDPMAPRTVDTAAWAAYSGGPQFIAALTEARAARAVWQALPGESWSQRIAEAAAVTVSSAAPRTSQVTVTGAPTGTTVCSTPTSVNTGGSSSCERR